MCPVNRGGTPVNSSPASIWRFHQWVTTEFSSVCLSIGTHLHYIQVIVRLSLLFCPIQCNAACQFILFCLLIHKSRRETNKSWRRLRKSTWNEIQQGGKTQSLPPGCIKYTGHERFTSLIFSLTLYCLEGARARALSRSISFSLSYAEV